MSKFKINEKIFREYDIRGIADTDLTSEVVQLIGQGIGAFLYDQGGRKISLGRDCRLSSDRIFDALSNGLLKSGISVVDISLVPTPLLYFSVFHLKLDGGIMITGSHNPGEYNGFKVCIGKSTVFGEDIQKIKQRILREEWVNGQGTLTQDLSIPDSYIDFVSKNVRNSLNLSIVVDSGNGMAGNIAPKLYRRLGCQVTELYSEPDGKFPNHHPDPTVIENLHTLQKAVTANKAICGIGFDGDADRIGVIDKTEKVIYGDELIALYAREILKKTPGATVISEVKASHRLFQDVAAHGGNPIMWKTGHSLIKAKMKETHAALAGEMSGHIFFNDRYFGYDDAIYAGARLLEILDEKKKSPSELLADLPPSFTTPEIRVDCPDEIKFTVVSKAKEAFEKEGLKVNGIDGARVEFADGWGLVRASNTGPVLVYRFEATSEVRLKEIRTLVESTVKRFM